MDLQEKRQLDLVKQAAGVRARARPWRAIIFTVLAIAAACVSYAFGPHLRTLFEPGHLGKSVGAASAAVAFLGFATIAVVSVASRARHDRASHPAWVICVRRRFLRLICGQRPGSPEDAFMFGVG